MNYLARGPAHLRNSNLLASDQPPLNSLPQGLTDEVALDRTGLDEVENRPERASEFEAGTGLYITFRQVSIME
ncbi:MAG: hypothetical protein ABSD13_18535 [Candidatus Korobacteraceae bacterium]